MLLEFRCTTLVMLVLSFFAMSTNSHASQPANRSLNVLFIAIDDLRPELASYQTDGIQTPNIDRLCARGLQFNAAYCQYPVCNASRSSFLTGMRPHELGIFSNRDAFRSKWPDITTLPQLFRESGYFSAGLGKLFHAGLDQDGAPTLFRDDLSFDYFYKAKGNEPSIGRKGEGRRLGDGKIKWATWRAAEGGDEGQADGMLAAEAIRILRMQRDQPFFLSVGFHKPHDPFVAPKEYFQSYPLSSIELNRDPSDKSALLRYALPDSYDRFRAFKDRDRREFKRAYHACTSFVDAQVGKLLDTLDREDLWETTVVVLVGDHGYHLGEHDWWNKVTLFDIGTRVPLVICAPNHEGMGTQTDAVVELLDLYPTICELAGIKPSHALSGKSLVPLLENPSVPWDKPAYSQVARGKLGMGYSVRFGNWRLTQWGKDGEGGVELYDVARDKEGFYNLSSSPDHQATTSKLHDLLSAGFPEISRRTN